MIAMMSMIVAMMMKMVSAMMAIILVIMIILGASMSMHDIVIMRLRIVTGKLLS